MRDAVQTAGSADRHPQPATSSLDRTHVSALTHCNYSIYFLQVAKYCSFWRECREQPDDAAASGQSEALSPAEAKVLARHCRAAAVEDLLLWLSGYEVGISQPVSPTACCLLRTAGMSISRVLP